MLQESTSKKYRHRLYTTVASNEKTEYRNWYMRNIVNGKLDRLKVEVHVFLEGTDGRRDAPRFEAAIRAAEVVGMKPAYWLVKKYRRISWSARSLPFVSAPNLSAVPLEDINAKTLEDNTMARKYSQWHSTMKWFPMRPKDHPDKNKKKREAREFRKERFQAGVDLEIWMEETSYRETEEERDENVLMSEEAN